MPYSYTSRLLKSAGTWGNIAPMHPEEPAVSADINALNAPTNDPRADKDWVNPWAQKGTESLTASAKCAACEGGDCFAHTPAEPRRHVDYGGRGTPKQRREAIERLLKTNRENEEKKEASVEIHETPKMLPQRDDMRTHLDEDEKKRMKDEGKIGGFKSAFLKK